MINIINKISFIGFCLGICLADMENLIIPILLTGISLLVFKITNEKMIFFIYFLLKVYYNINVINKE